MFFQTSYNKLALCFHAAVASGRCICCKCAIWNVPVFATLFIKQCSSKNFDKLFTCKQEMVNCGYLGFNFLCKINMKYSKNKNKANN